MPIFSAAAPAISVTRVSSPRAGGPKAPAAVCTPQRRCRRPTGAKADHRLPLKPSQIETLARALAADVGVAGVNRGGELPAGAQAWLAAVRNDLERESRLEHRRRRRRSAAGGACARARDERGARQRRADGSLYRCGRAAPGRSAAVDSRACGGDGGRTGRHAAHHRRQPRLHRARRFAVRRADEQGAGARASELARERDVGCLALADSRSAFPRGMERRARVRRHGVDRAAAHRAALRRALGPRSAGDAERSARTIGISDRAGILARATGAKGARAPTGAAGTSTAAPRSRTADPCNRCRSRVRGILAANRARRRDGEHRAADAGDHARGGDRRIRCCSTGRQRHRDRVPTRSHDSRRPFQQQRLAPGAAQTADASHLGQRGTRQPGDAWRGSAERRVRILRAASAARFMARSSRFAIEEDTVRGTMFAVAGHPDERRRCTSATGARAPGRSEPGADSTPARCEPRMRWGLEPARRSP